MLVLTRKLMEKLFIGDDICVTVVRLEGGQVRLGIDAPREVTVVRAELVPERAAQHLRETSHGSGAGAGRPMAHFHGPELTTRPPLVAHGNDSRRRGRSR
jgi:carbon storage regulator